MAYERSNRYARWHVIVRRLGTIVVVLLVHTDHIFGSDVSQLDRISFFCSWTDQGRYRSMACASDDRSPLVYIDLQYEIVDHPSPSSVSGNLEKCICHETNFSESRHANSGVSSKDFANHRASFDVVSLYYVVCSRIALYIGYE